MVETIADLSVALGIPFISGKDSSSGTFEAAGRRIDVPPTLAVAVMGRVPDAKRIVTKEFKSPGNRLVLVGESDPSILGGTVYADVHGQRGNQLFDGYNSASIRRLWDPLLKLHREETYVGASSIGEGGVFMRLFEAAIGSGLGARLELTENVKGRRDGWLFGEFIGSALLEFPPHVDLGTALAGIPFVELGKVTEEAELSMRDGGKEAWRVLTADLKVEWTKVFEEVMG
jgi:phosphoribosylformylglycinamidine (FGAM) synthase-like enzyme